MSILNTNSIDNVTESKLSPNMGGGYSLNGKEASISPYNPSPGERAIRSMIIKHFALGYATQRKPRVEFNDLSLVARATYDQMSFNTYQPNNGDTLDGDLTNSWKSKAIRPIVRNKCISIAAHATARLLYPRIVAQDRECKEDKDAAIVMADLVEFATNQADYEMHALNRVIMALSDPCSIGYTEYSEVYRTVKTEKVNGKWKTEKMLDETLSGFKSIPVSYKELFIENIYEPDVQKQGWLIWRKVISYSLAELKYKKFDNFKFVLPGIQTIFNDANDSFYNVYDSNMRQEDVEEVIYWNKTLDLKIVQINGIMIDDCDNPNPRKDKLYPFDKFGYEIISPNFFYYKSLSFKLQQDAKIINTLYPMIIDGTYLDIFPAMINTGGETIGSDVLIPGSTVTFSDKDADLRAINTGNPNKLRSAIETKNIIEESLQETSSDNTQNSVQSAGGTTAYEISRIEQNASIVLGLFIKMRSSHIKQYGTLLVGDILQHLTIVDVNKIVDNAELIYKTFLMPINNQRNKSKRIKFDGSVPDEMNKEEKLKASYDIINEQGDHESEQEIWKVNPKVFRDLKFSCVITPDVQNPMSEDLERAFALEEYDRMIMNPLSNQEETFKLLLEAYPKTKKAPDKYIKKEEPVNPMNIAQQQLNQPNMPQAGNSPLNAMKGKTPLPQAM